MLCCLKFLYGGSNASASMAMKLNQNNIQLDTAKMGNNMAPQFTIHFESKVFTYTYHFFALISQAMKSLY